MVVGGGPSVGASFFVSVSSKRLLCTSKTNLQKTRLLREETRPPSPPPHEILCTPHAFLKRRGNWIICSHTTPGAQQKIWRNNKKRLEVGEQGEIAPNKKQVPYTVYHYPNEKKPSSKNAE
eukprot:GEMP01053239.1.p1 GENE.GEMP01053239.1~~GEMP01053239.1.p1  ORF type:complete len:121 (+),score=14.23 GEMP01053239.1:859-1221(+)